MRNPIVRKIEKELFKLDPLRVSMSLEMNANAIMDLLFELEKYSVYKKVANKAIGQLARTINKEVHHAVIVEFETHMKNSPKSRKMEYHDCAKSAIVQIHLDLKAVLDL